MGGAPSCDANILASRSLPSCKPAKENLLSEVNFDARLDCVHHGHVTSEIEDI
jgi:hypothetical protein